MKLAFRTFLVAVALVLVLVSCAKATPTPAPATPAPAATPRPAATPAPAATPKPAATPAPVGGFEKPQRTYEIKIAGIMPITHFTQGSKDKLGAGELMAQKMEEYSQGQIKVIRYLGQSLYKDKEEIEGVRSGAVDIAYHTFSNWNTYVGAASIWDVPLLFNGIEHQVKTLPEVTILLDEALQKRAGVKLVGWILYGGIDAIGNNSTPFKAPGDMKGLKVRAFNIIGAEWMKSLGASPVIISSGEVYTALQRNTIDGVLSGSSSFTSRKWVEVLKYTTIVPYGNMLFGLAYNLDKWNDLEPAAQKIVLAAAQDAWEWSLARAGDNSQKAVDGIVEAGVDTYFVPEEDIPAWVATNSAPLELFLKDDPELSPKLIEIVEKWK